MATRLTRRYQDRAARMSYWRSVRPLVYLLVIVALAINWASKAQSWYWLLPPPESVPLAVIESEQRRSKRVSIDFIPDNVLASIEDKTAGVQVGERAALELMLENLQRIRPEHLPQVNEITYLHLMSSPQSYRGQVVQMMGTVQKVVPIELVLEEGIKRPLYEAWLTTPESGANLVHVYLQSTDGIEPEMPVLLTGLFFKQQGYQSVNGARLAPLIVAEALQPLSTDEAAVVKDSMSAFNLVVGTLGVALGVVCVVAYVRSGRKRRALPSPVSELDDDAIRAGLKARQDAEE